MWLRRKPDEHRHRHGFVLVEVLVTAAVAAVLLAALMRAFSSVWGGIGAVREETEAMLVARAVLEASTPRANLAPLNQEGMSGRYAWAISVANTGLQSAAANPQNRLQSQSNAAGQFGTGRPTTPAQPAATGQPGSNQQQTANSPDEQANREVPWTLFRIAVAVRAPSGRRTTLETFRLSRPAVR